MKMARVLMIAGSDSGGGAGIQADIKTATMLGAYAMTAVTALTVQDTAKLHAVEPVAPALIAAQIKTALSDIGADAVKIGLVPDAAAAQAIAEALAQWHGPLVLDPVLVATSGDPLSEAGQALCAYLFAKATLLTPNIPEAEAILGHTIPDASAMAEELPAFSALTSAAVLLKGGHLRDGPVIDMLYMPDGAITRFESSRINTRHTHGTGCTLASAIATGLGQGLAMAEAVARARDFVRMAMEKAPGFGCGHGPLGHAAVRPALSASCLPPD